MKDKEESGRIAPCGREKKSVRRERLGKSEVIKGVAQKRQGQSRIILGSEGWFHRQPQTPEQMSGKIGFRSDLTRRQESPIRSFQSAAEMGTDLPGCSEILMSTSAVNSELYNAEVLNNLSISIFQLISLLFIKGISANQIVANANMQDVSSVWTVPNQQTNIAFRSINITSTDTAHID